MNLYFCCLKSLNIPCLRIFYQTFPCFNQWFVGICQLNFIKSYKISNFHQFFIFKIGLLYKVLIIEKASINQFYSYHEKNENLSIMFGFHRSSCLL